MSDNQEINTRQQSKLSFAETLRKRVRATKTTRWIRFAIVTVVFFLWVIWMNSPWLSLLWLLLVDIYITGIIPWTWWKRSRSKVVRSVMVWVDAIIYCLVVVYFIFAFLGQRYNIPSSSLEKSLLVGDYLWVNKAAYGARVPQTPLHFPLADNKMPLIGGKSYITNPQLKYKRLKGYRTVERGDIVVFNYPQGDTVLSNVPLAQGDYYFITSQLRDQGIKDPVKYLRDNRSRFGDIIWHPVDRREAYVKRAIGLPGERLRISGDTVYINGKPIAEPTHVQFNYLIETTAMIPEARWTDMGVSRVDIAGEKMGDKWFYNVPLTKAMLGQVSKWPELVGEPQREGVSGLYDLGGVFPTGDPYGWTRPEMGELWIPKRGVTLILSTNNLPIYERAIRVYEGNDLQVRNGQIYINGKPCDRYTFTMDYYWMMGDNRDRSADSRYWGFVPEDHIIGTPMFVELSLDPEKSGFKALRWERMFRSANPDKDNGLWNRP